MWANQLIHRDVTFLLFSNPACFLCKSNDSATEFCLKYDFSNVTTIQHKNLHHGVKDLKFIPVCEHSAA